MNCTMNICEGDVFQRISNPTQEMIKLEIDLLIPVKYHFIILNLEKPVQNCEYIQTTMKKDCTAGIIYILEAGFGYSGRKRKHFRIFLESADSLKNIFWLFASGIIPNVTDWVDVTKEIFPKQ